MPIMDPSFKFSEGYYLDRSSGIPYLKQKAGFAATDFIFVGSSGSITWFQPQTKKDTGSSTKQLGHLLLFQNPTSSSNYTDYWNNNLSGLSKTASLANNRQYIRLGFDPDTMADMYAYNSSTGQVYFAGKNTIYYGKKNIND